MNCKYRGCGCGANQLSCHIKLRRFNNNWVCNKFCLLKKLARKLLEESLASDIELLKEMKKVRCEGGGQAELPDKVAGAEGESAIVEKFRDVYSSLYTSAGWAGQGEVEGPH